MSSDLSLPTPTIDESELPLYIPSTSVTRMTSETSTSITIDESELPLYIPSTPTKLWADTVAEHDKDNQEKFETNESTQDHKKQLCLFFLKGSCAFGDECNFLHEQQPSSVPLCSYFLKGRCKFGATCIYSHQPVNDRKYQNRGQDRSRIMRRRSKSPIIVRSSSSPQNRQHRERERSSNTQHREREMSGRGSSAVAPQYSRNKYTKPKRQVTICKECGGCLVNEDKCPFCIIDQQQQSKSDNQ
jgi:hypothetical protein